MSNAQHERTEQRFDRLDAAVEGLTADVEILKTDVAGLKTDVHKIGIQQEAMSDDLQFLAEKVGSQTETMERGFAEIRAEMRAMVAPLAMVVKSHSAELHEHGARISALERRGRTRRRQ